MFFIDTIEVPGLGNRGYLAGGARTAVVIDPPRDVDRVIAAAARRGVRIAYVCETHVHNDYVSGGLELARLTGSPPNCRTRPPCCPPTASAASAPRRPPTAAPPPSARSAPATRRWSRTSRPSSPD